MWLSSRAFIAAAFWFYSTPFLRAQTAPEARLANEIRSAADSVSSPVELSQWNASHTGERIDLAHYDSTADLYEVDLTNQWCVTSVSEAAPGVTRAASFFVPDVTRGALPPLPPKQDSSLTDSCRLGGIWVELQGSNIAAAVARELTGAWGEPGHDNRRELGRTLFIAGSGLWKDASTWRRGNVTVWVAWTDWNKGNGVASRTIAWVARDRPPDPNPFGFGFDITAAAAKIAALSPALTADVHAGDNCARLGPGVAAGRLSQWLNASRNMAAERRAAALLVADSFAACAVTIDAKPASLAALGMKLATICPQDGPGYAGNFRDEAAALDPGGPAGALAALASLQSPCSLTGSGSWPDHVLAHGREFPRRYPEGPWSPWVTFAMARAHEAKLSFSVPPGEADIGVIHSLTAPQSLQERASAVADFRQFIHDQPDSPDAVFAWIEAWRLMAGLPPATPRFGCGCE